MTSVVIALLVLAAGTYLAKALGPVLLGGRELPPVLAQLTQLLTAALLAALVATQTLANGASLQLDARAIGLLAAAVAVWLRAPFAVVVVIGAGVTAGVRALGWG